MLLGGDDAADDDVQRAQLRLQLLIRLQHALQVGSVLSARRVSIAAQPVTLGGDPLVLAAQLGVAHRSRVDRRMVTAAAYSLLAVVVQTLQLGRIEEAAPQL